MRPVGALDAARDGYVTSFASLVPKLGHFEGEQGVAMSDERAAVFFFRLLLFRLVQKGVDRRSAENISLRATGPSSLPKLLSARDSPLKLLFFAQVEWGEVRVGGSGGKGGGLGSLFWFFVF